MDPRAWNRFSYVYGNPVNYTDSSGHCIDGISTWVCIGAAFALGGVLNVAVGYATTDNYFDSPGRVALDFGVGGIFGVAAYAVGPGITAARLTGFGIRGAQVVAPVARVISLGVLNVGESYLTSRIRGGEFNAGEAFLYGAIGGVVGEGIGASAKIASKYLTGRFTTARAAVKATRLSYHQEIRAFERQLRLQLRNYKILDAGVVKYPRKIVDTYIRRRDNRIAQISTSSLQSPQSPWVNEIKFGAFLATTGYGDAESYSIVYSSLR